MGRGSSAFAAILVLSILGCGKHKAKPDDSNPKKPSKPMVQDVNLGEGHTTIYPNATAKLPSFSVKWQKGGFDAKTGTVDTGHLETVSGDIFQNGKKSSEYAAPRGDADRAAAKLRLTGGAVLRSADGTQTMRADVAEYREGLKLIRAIGNVRASGPFGTLSGVPEMWATPDLHLIGTPDMVSKTLKLSALASLAATAAVARPGVARFQAGDDYQVPKFGPTLADLRTPGHTKTTIQPPKDGPTVLIIPSRGLTFRFSGTVLLDAVMANGKRVVRHMTAQGPVNVVQVGQDGERTTMDGTGAEFDAVPGAATADLSVGGRVTLVTTAKDAGTTTSQGDKGSAVLRAQPTSDQSALKSATLTGNVTIVSKGAKAGDFDGVGDRMVYEPGAQAAEVDLTGRVTLTSVTKSTDADGKPASNAVVSKGDHAHAQLQNKPAAGASPLNRAVMDGGVTIDVSGTNGQRYKGSGDKLVYTAEGDGGKAVMTGNLKFSGDTPEFFTNSSGADTAIVTIGKSGLETVALDNSKGAGSNATIKLPPQAPKSPSTPKKTTKKGGKP